MSVSYKTLIILVKISISYIPLGFSLRPYVVGWTKRGVLERTLFLVFGDCPTFSVPVNIAIIRSKYII
jgi:hypothetical protein